MPYTLEEIQEQLSQGVPDAAIYTREGSRGAVLSYIKEDYQVDELNRIFGVNNWSDEVIHCKPVTSDLRTWEAKVEVTATIGDSKITHSGIGTCGVMGRSEPAGDVLEMAIKGAATDAFKRAARKFGKRLGNGLKGEEAVTEVQNQYAAGGNNQRPAPQPNTQNRNAAPVGSMASHQAQRTESNGGEVHCPQCSGAMYDQRRSQYYGNGIAQSGKAKPIYKCQDKQCNGAIWPTDQQLEQWQSQLYANQPQAASPNGNAGFQEAVHAATANGFAAPVAAYPSAQEGDDSDPFG